MSKICPKCRRPQENPAHLGCEKCRVPFVEAEELITSFTQAELKFISTSLLKDWRVYVVAGLFLLIGVGILYWQAREHIKTEIERFQSDVSNQVVRAYSIATNQISSRFENLANDASNQISHAHSLVVTQITEEFQTPRIKQTVEMVAKSEAKEILETEVNPIVQSFKNEAIFMRTIARAQGYDFKAYQTLLNLEADNATESAKIAAQVLNELDKSLARDNSDFTPKRSFAIMSGTNIYRGPFSSDEIALSVPSIFKDSSYNKEAWVNIIAEKKLVLFLPTLVTLLTNETDLSVADRITTAISQLANEHFNPRDLKKLEVWWHFYQKNYTNWPFDSFNAGIKAFNSDHFSEAADSFHKVVQLDKFADISRTLTIICAIQIGNSNTVETLNHFEDSNSRWAKLTTALIALKNGSVSNATVELALTGQSLVL